MGLRPAHGDESPTPAPTDSKWFIGGSCAEHPPLKAQILRSPRRLKAHQRNNDYARRDESPGKEVGGTMIERKLSIADLILIAGTRVALGAGFGLLLSNRLSKDQRNAAGLALALVG